MEYRIKEEYNKFYPQVKLEEKEFVTITGITTKTTRWVYMDEYTNAPIKDYVHSHQQGNHQKDKVCTTLEEARLYIKSLSKGIQYYTVTD